jgi:hypothetical protein
LEVLKLEGFKTWSLDVLTVFSSVSRLTHIYVSAPHFLHKNGPQFILIKKLQHPSEVVRKWDGGQMM